MTLIYYGNPPYLYCDAGEHLIPLVSKDDYDHCEQTVAQLEADNASMRRSLAEAVTTVNVAVQERDTAIKALTIIEKSNCSKCSEIAKLAHWAIVACRYPDSQAQRAAGDRHD